LMINLFIMYGMIIIFNYKVKKSLILQWFKIQVIIKIGRKKSKFSINIIYC
jgi:hypothetical protein